MYKNIFYPLYLYCYDQINFCLLLRKYLYWLLFQFLIINSLFYLSPYSPILNYTHIDTNERSRLHWPKYFAGEYRKHYQSSRARSVYVYWSKTPRRCGLFILLLCVSLAEHFPKRVYGEDLHPAWFCARIIYTNKKHTPPTPSNKLQSFSILYRLRKKSLYLGKYQYTYA